MDTSACPLRRPDTPGVHSLDRFAFSVPDIDDAKRFYRAFGLDVREQGKRLDLHTRGDDDFVVNHEAPAP